jgi:hypothetical protein
MLKAATVYHVDQQWTEALNLTVFGIRTAFKLDLWASVAELICSELLTLTADLVEPTHLITQLRQHMTCLTPFLAAHNTSLATSVHHDIQKCMHIFLHQDTTHRALKPLTVALPVAVTTENSAAPRARQARHRVN